MIVVDSPLLGIFACRPRTKVGKCRIDLFERSFRVAIDIDRAPEVPGEADELFWSADWRVESSADRVDRLRRYASGVIATMNRDCWTAISARRWVPRLFLDFLSTRQKRNSSFFRFSMTGINDKINFVKLSEIKRQDLRFRTIHLRD